MGIGSVGLLLGAIAFFLPKLNPAPIPPQPTPTAAASFPIMPCNEPSVPPLPERKPDHEYKDGTRFYGKFADGAPADGRGIMVFNTGQRYDGDYRNGKRNGCGTMTFDENRRYTGQFKDDQFEGLGIWTLENGDRYIGEFHDNKCNGVGTFILKDGSSQSGNWENGRLVDGKVSCDREPFDLPDAPE
jgi:hypothetical protein